MIVQIVWIFLFVLNLLLLWSTFNSGKGAKYRLIGILIWTFIIFYLPFTSQPQLVNIPAWHLIGTLIFLLGVFLFISAQITLLKTGLPLDYIIPPKLVTEGPYKIVRHPQYLAFIIIFIGLSIARGAIISVWLTPIIILLHFIESTLEEKIILEKIFTQKYKEYQKNVGMLFPKIK